MLTLEPPSKNLWSMQLLTQDYIVTGYLDSDKDKYALHLVGGVTGTIPLVNARFRPTGILTAAAPPSLPWAVIYGESLVAIIPRDEAGLGYAMQVNESFKTPVPAMVYAGPYALRGKILVNDARMRVFAAFSKLAMQDVEIRCLLPGASLAPFNVSYVLLTGSANQITVPLPG